MRNLNNTLILIYILFLGLAPACMAQAEKGFLLQCYNTRNLKDTSSYNYIFSLYLSEHDFVKMDCDSLYIDSVYHDFYFSRQLNKLFNEKAQFVEAIPKQNEKVDPDCKINRSLNILDFSSIGLIQSLLINNDYIYIFKINKIAISACALRSKNDYYPGFKRRIGISTLELLAINPEEVKTFKQNLGKLKTAH